MDVSKGKALVTGGSSGIGLETARQLRARGAQVAICGRHESRLKEAASSIGALAIHADVAREADVAQMVRRVIDTFGGYDILINNAGFGLFAPLLETELETMQRVYATNVFGAMLVARESARYFVEQRRGNIVNVASTAGQRGFAGGTAYASSKFALSGMTECWRAELRKHDVRVMQINPSEVQTEFVAASGRMERPHSERKLIASDIAQTIVAMLELPDRGFIPETSVWATNPD
jgi:3-oxoacyl-[acyl-carrier protein] reductase